MKLLTLNLRHGGGRHHRALTRSLLRQGADVLVLTEFRNNAQGEALRAGLAARGLSFQAAGPASGRENTLLIAARSPFQPEPQPLLACDPPRLMAVRFEKFSLVAVHLPNLKAKIPHWQALLQLAEAEPATPRMLVGDFNTGLNGVDGENFRFTCAAEMERLLEMGWADAWRRLHPRGRQFTWYSHRGRGFRLDHAFLSPPMVGMLRKATFSHGVRERGLTDHSALRVELDLEI